jgi:Carboxypeptidase regulatory-like domain
MRVNVSLTAQIWTLMAASALVWAQGTGSISGMVYDPLNEPLPSAEVRVATASRSVKTATTSSGGMFSVDGLPAGNYQVGVYVQGGRKFAQDVTVAAGQTAKLDVHLKDDGQLGAIGDNSFAAAALARRPTPTGPTPRTPDGHPDLTGMWSPSARVSAEMPEMLPWAEKEFKERIANHTKDIPTSKCLPWGPTFDVPTVFKFIQAPKTIIVLTEDVFPYRQIFLDGRLHPKDADPTWMGNSIGHWEGDTLVVDTAGFNDKGWSPIPYPRTEMFHMIERIQRPDMGHIEIETTVDDPGTYKKPWKFKLASTLLVGEEIGEYVCTENNQYAGHAR